MDFTCEIKIKAKMLRKGVIAGEEKNFPCTHFIWSFLLILFQPEEA